MAVHSYLRYSRGHQRKGRSEKRQTLTAEGYCARRGWTLDTGLYADRGVSGFRGDNVETGDLGRFLRDCESGKVKSGDVLIVESLDRLTRAKVRSALKLFLSIMEYGVVIVTLDPEREYSGAKLDDEGFGSLLEALVIMARANEESERKSSRGKDVWKGRRVDAREKKKPTNGACPKWLKYDASARKYAKNPERVAVVRRMFDLCLEGKGCRQIVGIFNREKVATFGKARLWDVGAVGRVLRSKTVMGEHQPKVRDEKGGRVPSGNPVQGYYPEVITPEIFWRAQGLLNGRNVLKIRGREGKEVANLFTGLLWCAEDGSPMQYKKTTAGKYLDSERAFNGEIRGNGFLYPIFEKEVLAFLAGDLTLERRDKGPKLAKVDALDAELKACEIRLKRTVATMAACDDEDVHASLAEVLATQTQQKKALQHQLDRAKADAEGDSAKDMESLKNLIGVCMECNSALREGHTSKLVDIRGVEDVGDVRAQIKNKLRLLVSEVWVSVKAEGWRRKTCTVEIHFRQGGVKALEIRTEPGGKVTSEPLMGSGLKKRKA